MSMSFREQVADDFLNVFLNPEEFGRVCNWNGGELRIAEGASDNLANEEIAGLTSHSKMVFCRSCDLPRLPRPDERVLLDGERWRVVDAQPQLGHFIVLLERETP